MMAEPDLQDWNVLGIDYGERRIGLAIKPAGRKLILPIAVVPAEPVPATIDFLRKLIDEREIKLVVIGLPVHPDERQMKRVKKFSRKLRSGIRGVRWVFEDERLTSVEAEGKSRKPPRDDAAAVLILRDYLSRRIDLN